MILGLSAEKTRIIASLAPASMAEALEARAALSAGISIVEFRLDALAEEPGFAALRDAYPDVALLATLRSKSEGGGFCGTRAEAERVLRAALDAGFDFVDVELKSEGSETLLGFEPARVVVSAHDFGGIPDDLDSLHEAMRRTGAGNFKIVGTARDSSGATRLLAFQRRNGGGRLSAFAMGEAGLSTRVLSPYLGAPLAFGSLVPGRETAPGQIPACDLHDIYGIGRARNAERLFALFGGAVSHSLSPAIHNANFEAGGERALYVPFALDSLLKEFDPFVVAFDGLGLPLKGASITFPFKEEAATVALFRGERVANTLVRSGEAYIASNTDRTAMASFAPLGAPSSRALVLGAGGTARTAVEVLTSRRFDVHVWSRDPVRAHELTEEIGGTFLPKLEEGTEPFVVLVNATPVGMKREDPLLCPESFLHEGLVVIDAPYCRGGTRLAHAARRAGARVFDGHALLLAQAARQAELFTGRPVTAEQLLSQIPPRIQKSFEVSEVSEVSK